MTSSKSNSCLSRVGLMLIAITTVQLLAAPLVEARQPLGVKITGPDDSFTAAFPQTPRGPHSIHKVKMQFGFGTLRYYASQKNARQSVYLLAWMNYPPRYLDRGRIEPALAEVRDSVAQTRSGKVIDESNGQYAGYPTKDFVVVSLFNSRTLYDRVRLIAVKDRIYRLVVSETSKRPASEKVDAYFESFKPGD